MSIDFTLRSTSSLSRSKKLEFLNDSNKPILKTSQDLFTEGLDSFLNDFTFIPFTLPVKDSEGQLAFSLHKKRSSPISSINYVIIYSGGRIQLHEGKKFKMPNLTMDFQGRTINLLGRVMDLYFYLEEKGEKIATFSGLRLEKGKEYQMSILDESLPLELVFGCALILDNLYFDY